jgi:hypothetical protein
MPYILHSPPINPDLYPPPDLAGHLASMALNTFFFIERESILN